MLLGLLAASALASTPGLHLPVLHRAGGAAKLDVEVAVELQAGRLEVRATSGAVRYRSSPDLEVLGWAPMVVGGTPSLLLWFLRRDENERGVVAHDSGWMTYGHTPWINHHVALLVARGAAVAPRWMSSGLAGVDAVWVEPPATVLLRRRREVERYAFSGWALQRVPGRVPALAEVEVSTGLIEVLSTGDVMLGRATGRALDRLGPATAFKAVKPWFDGAQLRLGNLESCFTADETRREGPRSFFAPRRHLQALSFLGFDALSLANNHCDAADAEHSRRVLAEAGIRGLKPWVSAAFMRQGVRLEVLGLTALPGEAAGLMTPQHASRLEALAGQAELVVALVHWGVELSEVPTEEQRRLGAWLVRHGVNAVLGHHPHVVQPLEAVDATHVIAFSQGNFVFDQEGYTGTAETERGAVVQLRYHRRLGLTARARPVTISRRAVVRPAEADAP